MDLRRLAADEAARPVRMPTLPIWVLSLLALQFLFGAYVAGLEAGYAYSSWPLMGDEWFPADAPMLEPYLRNFVDNPIVVQFVHRWLAFVFAGAALLLAAKAWARGLQMEAAALVASVTVQILLGIFTLLTGVDIYVATAHQGMAALVLGAVLICAHRLGQARA
jgi:cytochrome c oxidase assembly protein subunit 15